MPLEGVRDEAILATDGGVIVTAHRSTGRVHTLADDGRIFRISPPELGARQDDDWSPDRRHYVWSAGPGANREAGVFAWTVAQPSVRLVASGVGNVAAFAGGWVLIDRSPWEPALMAPLEGAEQPARESSLGTGFVAFGARAAPPAWLGLSQSGELWLVPIDGSNPGTPQRLATGLSPHQPFVVAGTRAIAVTQNAQGGQTLVGIETFGAAAGTVVPMTGAIEGAQLEILGRPIGGSLHARVTEPETGHRTISIPLRGGVPFEWPRTLFPLLESDLGTVATTEIGGPVLAWQNRDLVSVRPDHRPVRLMAAKPAPAVAPANPFEAVPGSPGPVAWPAVGPSGTVLVARGDELWLVAVGGGRPARRVKGARAESLSGFRWSPDGHWVAGVSGQRVVFIEVQTARAHDVRLSGPLIGAWGLAWWPERESLIVSVARKTEATLLAVSATERRAPEVLMTSPDTTLWVIDSFGGKPPWAHLRAPSLTNRVGRTWYRMADEADP